MGKRKDTVTGDLFEWVPPEPQQKFDETTLRAFDLSMRFSKAISKALSESEFSRSEIAKKMSEFLDQHVSIDMLNAYASQARNEHNISLPRFIALVHATQDWRLLSAVTDPFPMIVVDARYADVIRLTQVREQRERLEKEEKALHRAVRSEGLI